MKKTLAILISLIGLCAVYGSAQAAACPKIETHGPSNFVTAGDPITFIASINGRDPKAVVKYDWTISAGKITKGQGQQNGSWRMDVVA